jgi:hypothetical protein
VWLAPEQIAAILGGQTERVLAGEEPLDLGPAPGQERLGYSVLLERLTSLLSLAVGRMLMGRTGYEPLALARLACDLGDEDAPEADVCRNVLELLQRQERFAKENPGDGAPLAPGIRLVMLAACVARTPDVAVPSIPELAGELEIRRAATAGHRIIDATSFRQPVSKPRDLRRSSVADHLIIDPSGRIELPDAG